MIAVEWIEGGLRVGDYSVLLASMDLWPKAKAFHEQYLASQWNDRITTDPRSFERYYYLAISDPNLGVLLVLDRDERVVGMAMLQATRELAWDITWADRTLVRGVFVKPGTSLRATRVLERAGEEWARQRGHDKIIGFVRTKGFKFHAADRLYGFRATRIVVEKEVRADGRRV